MNSSTEFLDSIWKDLNSLDELTNDSKQKIDTNCKNCGEESQNFIDDSKMGDTLCIRCGLVQSRYIADEPEWNNYTEDGILNSSNIRCSNSIDNTNPYDIGNTFIPKYMWTANYDANGIKRYTNLSRLAIRISYSSKHRAFDEGKHSFERIQSLLNLSDSVFNTAKLFWGIILKTDILKRGANRIGMKACCIFYACMCEKQQRSREDIAAAFDINGLADFTKGEKIFREIFEKNNEYSWILYKDSNNESMYSRYVKQLNLPYKATKSMIIIKEQCKDHLLGIAAKSEIAGLLFYTVREVLNLKHPNKTEIAKLIGICNPTLNKVIEILKYFYSLNPDLKKKLLI
jgi:transcription initiation factor TFIIIB Brf1 subunit/transcription initiation factor TFIIB